MQCGDGGCISGTAATVNLPRLSPSMNPLAILTSLEGAVFEAVVWLLLIPKTLFQVLRHPAWVVDYTAAQFQKAEADRWDDYLSPVVFWLLLAVGPYLGDLRGPAPARRAGQLSGDVLSHLPLPTRYLLLALLLVAAPATLAVLFARIRGHGLARRLLRQHFAAQCYLQTPTLLCVMPIVVSVLFAPRAEMLAHFSGTVSLIGLAGLSLLWLLAAETVYLQQDLSASRGRTFGIALGSTLLGGVIVSSLIVAAAHVAHKAHLLLPHA